MRKLEILVALTIGAIIVAALVLMVAVPAEGHGENHRDVITVQGTPFCVEDERLVPVKHHGYHPERTGGWVYTCKPFDSKGKFAR